MIDECAVVGARVRVEFDCTTRVGETPRPRDRIVKKLCLAGAGKTPASAASIIERAIGGRGVATKFRRAASLKKTAVAAQVDEKTLSRIRRIEENSPALAILRTVVAVEVREGG